MTVITPHAAVMVSDATQATARTNASLLRSWRGDVGRRAKDAEEIGIGLSSSTTSFRYTLWFPALQVLREVQGLARLAVWARQQRARRYKLHRYRHLPKYMLCQL